MSRQEQFATMFAAIDTVGQDFILDMLVGEYERVQKVRRPVLHLIQGGPPAAAPTKASVLSRTKKKESA